MRLVGFWRRNVIEARWLSVRRLRLWSIGFAVVAAQFAFVGGFHTPHNAPPDFLALWAAGRMVRDGAVANVYNWDAHAAVMHTQIQFDGLLPWLHLPTALFLVTLFGLLPYHVAFALWVTVGAAIYVRAVKGVVQSWPIALGALGAGVTIWNTYSGQTGFILAAALIGVFLLADRRPVLAGLCLALFILKPQLAVMVPVWALAERRWKLLASAAVASVGAVVASGLAFGWHRWVEFVDTSRIIARSVDQGDAGFKVESLYSIARLTGLPWPAAAALYLVLVAGLSAVIVGRVRVRPAQPALVAATVVVATLLAAPRLLTYDTQLLVAACAFLVRHGRGRGFLPYEKVLLMLALLCPFLAVLDVPSGMVGVLIVGGLTWRRWAQVARGDLVAQPRLDPATVEAAAA